MSQGDKGLTIRISQDELDTLKAYCDQEKRNQTDVLREFIRGLKRKIKNA